MSINKRRVWRKRLIRWYMSVDKVVVLFFASEQIPFLQLSLLKSLLKSVNFVILLEQRFNRDNWNLNILIVWSLSLTIRRCRTLSVLERKKKLFCLKRTIIVVFPNFFFEETFLSTPIIYTRTSEKSLTSVTV